MITLPEARSIMSKILGDEAVRVFDYYVDDLQYCVRSWALTDMKSPIDLVRGKLETVSRGIVKEALKAYLSDNFATSGGSLELNIGSTIYDKSMNEIPAVEQIKKHQANIVECLVAQCSSEFDRGRVLAHDILDRSAKYTASNHHDPSRDYEALPPMEAVEIKIMRLEASLPNLSIEDGDRLVELYKVLREYQCDGT